MSLKVHMNTLSLKQISLLANKISVPCNSYNDIIMTHKKISLLANKISVRCNSYNDIIMTHKKISLLGNLPI